MDKNQEIRSLAAINSASQFRRFKYHNKPTDVDGIRFASKKEANRYQLLKLLERNGDIKDLKLQPRFILQEAFEKNGIKYRAITYIADFQYLRDKKLVVEDTKGFRNNIFLLKQKLFEYNFPELNLVLV